MDDAYAIQGAWVRRKISNGRTVKGWKIRTHLQSDAVCTEHRHPDSGVLLDDMFFNDGDVIPKDRFIQPRIEAEIAFVMKSDLSGPDCTPEAVLAATDHVSPSLEILDTRILRADPETCRKARTIFDTISDNAANAGIVLRPTET